MRVNLGCGDRYVEGGWVNVDHGSPHRMDVDVDLLGPLPWPEQSITHAYCGHVLEHLPYAECAVLLARLLPCMQPGGQIMVVGPDLPRAEAMAKAGTLDVTLNSLRYGAERWPGDRHLWECTPDALVGLLTVTGWVGITPMPIGDVDPLWPVADRGPQWQCAVTAHRPAEDPR